MPSRIAAPLRALSLLGLVVLGTVTLAADAPAPLRPVAAIQAPALPFEKYRLANGLEVILSQDSRLPLVAVNLWYHVGPANEKPGRTGFAHLFEHMMFQGSKHVPSGMHIKLVEGAGGEMNGTTSFDRTNYFETVPSNQLELALWLESDRMGFLLDTLSQAELSNQQDVVRNERRQSTENRPYGLVEEALFHTLFPKGHPYYASIIGSHADIEAARLSDVQDFFREYYAPNNASIAIVGDFDKARAKALVEKYFGPIAAGPPVAKIEVKTPAITAERRVTVTDRVELPRVIMSWLTPAVYKPGDADADLAADVLGGGKPSRLYKKLVYELQIAQDVSASQYSLALGSVFSIEATARPGIKPEQLEAAIDAELARFRTDGPSAAEIERARNSTVAGMVRGLESLGGFGGVADTLNRYNHFLGDPGYLPQDLARYSAVTPATVRAFVGANLRKEARVVVYGLPGEKVIDDVPQSKPAVVAAADDAPAMVAVAAASDWRKTVPAAAAEAKLTLPVPQRSKLDNGLTLLLVEQHKLPVVSANLVVLAGSDHNPATKPGLASFTADMLDEGTKTRGTLQIAEDLDQIGAALGSGSTTDASTVFLRTLKPTADDAFALMADVVLNPAFSAEEIDRVRASRLTQLVQQKDNPTAVAQRVFNQALFGPQHPYGYTELGTQKSVQAITRADMTTFWQQGYTPGNTALIVSGDITMAELRALAQKHFGAWRGASAPATVPEGKAPAARSVLLVDRPGAPQTSLRIGTLGAKRSSPDYVPLEVMNNSLGGLFTSRINLNLREKNGYAYSSGSAFGFRRGTGPFVVVTSVRTDSTAPAVGEIFTELARMGSEPVTASELDLAKQSFSRSLPALFETTADSAASSGQLFVYGLPLDYFNTLPGRIEAVTSADLQRVAKQYIVPGKMIVVAVGDKAKIEPGLRKLEIGTVETRSVE
ncbi:MAG: pitrilysin family protein [Pseudomonadota bacterium]